MLDSHFLDQLDFQTIHVVAGQNHLYAFGQGNVAGDIGGVNVELRAIAGEERAVTAAFFLAQDVDRAFKLGVGGDGTGLGQNHTAFNLGAIDTAQQDTSVIASQTLVQQFVEHFDAGGNGAQGLVHQANDFNGVVELDHTALDTAGNHGTAAFDAEDVFNGHHEGLVGLADGILEVIVHGVHQLHDRLVNRIVGVGGSGFQGLFGRTADDRYIIAREVVVGEQLANFHLNQLEQFGVIHLVDLVQEDQNGGNFNLVGQEHVLVGLGHRTIGGADDQNGAVNLGRTGDHVLDVVTVTRHVHMGIVALGSCVFNMGDVDCDTAGFFLGGVIDGIVRAVLTETAECLHLGDGSGQGGFAMVNMTHGTNVHMGL